eukprot:CAMPEP_0179438898 /NCGR_PEP_ID=MMETSP0799-20121207/22557_1 /TAXON_ID=46947 /ORGANISM="Geminigera cryophila, Strain CCMP2564" /LENGTH=157 /DNA_ID=CAMNT_0021220827 /DNA_START=674 /DNA_END=1143 /DNA_ORIENTATION=+
MTTRGEEEVAADGAITARWFFQQGVAMQVQDTTGLEPCLRSFRAAARLLSDGQDDAWLTSSIAGDTVDARAQLYEMVQNASREVSLRAKARRVGGTLVMAADIHDSVGMVALKWWLGDDLRDVADFACCSGTDATPERCFEYDDVLAASRPAPLWGG